MDYVLPANFPQEPNSLQHNQQWVPIATEVYQGWIKIPVELSAKQFIQWENSPAAILLEEKSKWERPQGEDRPEILILYEGVHPFLYHMQFEGIDSQAIADASGCSLPSIQLARAVFQVCLPLIAKARRLGNSLRPFSGTPNPEAAANSPAEAG